MNILCSGDWQCSVSNIDRCTVLVDHLEKQLQALRLKESTYFLHMGDIKEHLNPIDQRVTNFTLQAMKRLRKACNGAWFVRGNHDYMTIQDGIGSCAPVIHSADVTVADDDWVLIPVRLYTWNGKVVKYCLIYMVPYFREHDRQLEAFTKAAGHAVLSKKEYRDPNSSAVGHDNVALLAFHNTLTGCKQNLYTFGEGFTLDEICSSVYDYCVGGHIHVPQFIRPNIYFVGSPFAMDWGEINSDHRSLLINIPEERKR